MHRKIGSVIVKGASVAHGGSEGSEESPPEVRSVSSRIVYQNKWMTVREDEVEWPGGFPGIYGVVEKPDFSLVIPHHQGKFQLVEQYRYPVLDRFWEFPQGSWPAGNGGQEGRSTTGPDLEDATALARAELAEETGLQARSLRWLGRINVAHGYSSQRCQVFLAEELIPGRPRPEQTEVGMRQRWASRREVDALIEAGTFADSSSLAALALFDRFVGSQHMTT